MIEKWSPCCAAGLLISGITGIFSSAAGYAIEVNDYLRQVETEAKRMAISPITTRSPVAATSLDIAERLPLGLQREAFEKVLQAQFIGTYLFYRRLTTSEQRQIFNLYQQDNRVSSIREQTLKLLSNGGR